MGENETELELIRVAEQLCEQLGETLPEPRQQIQNIVRICGVDFAMQVFKEAQEIEAQGGMMLRDGSRRRTFGGVFFYLARGRMSYSKHRKIFGADKTWIRKSRDKDQSKPKTPPPPPPPAFKYDERLPILEALAREGRGEITSVKVTLIGKPGKTEVRQDLVIMMMEHTIKAPTLPKGVPKPPQTSTSYVVYISAKQWRKVEPALAADPDDSLIIEGVAAFDPEINGIALFTTNVSTKALMRQKFAPKPDTLAEGSGEPAARPAAAPTPARARTQPAPPSSPIEFPIPPHAPPEVVRKLRELHMAAATFRQKLAAIEAKPPGQRFGLEMTQKLLKNTEDQITALERQYS